MAEDKKKLLLTLGSRENQAIKEIESLIKSGKFPDNKNEIFRRGLHSAMQLIDVDEYTLLQLLREAIERSSKSLAKNDLELILALSLTIYGTMIVKKGVIQAEPFETVPNTCKMLLIDDSRIDKNSVIKTLQNLGSVVDTIFLKNGYDPYSDKISTSFLEDKPFQYDDQNSLLQEDTEKGKMSQWALWTLMGDIAKKQPISLGVI